MRSLALDLVLKELVSCNTWHRIKEKIPSPKMKKKKVVFFHNFFGLKTRF